MKALSTMNKAFVLAIVTLMSASAFAADGVGEKKDGPCQKVATNDGQKAQKSSNVQADEAPKSGAAKKAE